MPLQSKTVSGIVSGIVATPALYVSSFVAVGAALCRAALRMTVDDSFKKQRIAAARVPVQSMPLPEDPGRAGLARPESLWSHAPPCRLPLPTCMQGLVILLRKHRTAAARAPV